MPLFRHYYASFASVSAVVTMLHTMRHDEPVAVDYYRFVTYYFARVSAAVTIRCYVDFR